MISVFVAQWIWKVAEIEVAGATFIFVFPLLLVLTSIHAELVKMNEKLTANNACIKEERTIGGSAS